MSKSLIRAIAVLVIIGALYFGAKMLGFIGGAEVSALNDTLSVESAALV